MKKIFSILTVCAASALYSFAGGVPADASKLPEPAKQFIATNFPSAKIAAVLIDYEGMAIEDYKAMLSDGTQLKFFPTGDMKEVKNFTGVPPALVPAKISEYIAKTYAGMKVIELKKKWSGFDVKISSGMEMKFSPDGTFMGIDD
ncbi:MAG: PepSY-like domain-containing protein [Opitutales bacterium]|nr:PepSY-like domain-containing protein [Opitutales bacterium]